MADITTANAFTNTDPQKMINVINTEKKKKPHNITIKNYNPNEPKVYPNMKYTEKQNYRRYKTKTEPKLYSRIMIDEEDDIISTIKKAFGIEKQNKRNFSNVETSGANYVKDPEPPEHITQIAKGSENDTNTEFDLDEFEKELSSYFLDDDDDYKPGTFKFLPDTPPVSPGAKRGFSISTEITSAVASPALKTPEARAAELNKSKELDDEINAILETDEELKTRLFRGLKTEKEKEDVWNLYHHNLRVKEEQEEYKMVTDRLEVGAAGKAWTKHQKNKEDERKRLNEEKIDKGNEEYYQIRMNEFKRKKKPTLGEKELTYKDLKSLIDQRFTDKYASKTYKEAHPDKEIKNPLYYNNDYGLTHLWRVKNN